MCDPSCHLDDAKSDLFDAAAYGDVEAMRARLTAVASVLLVGILTPISTAQTTEWQSASGAVQLHTPEDWDHVSAHGYSLLIQEREPAGKFPGSCYVKDTSPRAGRQNAMQDYYNSRARNRTATQLAGAQTNLHILSFANTEFVDDVLLSDIEYTSHEGNLPLHSFIRQFAVLNKGLLYELTIVCAGPVPLLDDTRSDIEALMRSLKVDRE